MTRSTANSMIPVPSAGRWLVIPALLLAAAIWIGADEGYAATNELASGEIRIVRLQGSVEIVRAGATVGVKTTETNQVLYPGDRMRVGRNSRVTLRWSTESVITFDALTEIEILSPHTRAAEPGLRLMKGILSFFHRDTPGRIRIITRGAVAGVEGTEFVMAVEPVNDTERTIISVIDGKVRFSNEQDALTLINDEQAIAEPGKAPIRTPGFIANNLLQWCFYYPAVLDPADLPLTPEEQDLLRESLAAYRAGDLLAALDKYPAARQPGSDAERVFYAALVLSVGQVKEAEDALASLAPATASERLPRLADALRQLIAAVKRQPNPSALESQLATEFLAASYYEQSRAAGDVSLRAALELATRAATNSPDFGFAWERVAELEFSFGYNNRALDALNKSLALAPRNAQALALKGFLLAAQNRPREGIEWFDRAIGVDSGLGNAWLGRGLCRIHRSDTSGGREDLLVAAAVEPQRALLRSYLAKAYADRGDTPRATKELELAKDLDPNDPTEWLYSALLHQQNNRINEGVRDLEKSQALNENRSLYRSKLLLDEDRAVRSANLASLYRDAGMTDWSVREASQGVSYDYANHSAHLFLANSYDQLRDPNRINLRYETPAESEYLIANLLAPVGGRLLAQSVSQQEYSKLFERDGLGVASTTEYLSRGAWREQGAQFGTFANSSYLFEGLYRNDPGQRPNNDFEERELRLHFQQQLTPQDTIYFRAIHYKAEGGDVFQYYNQTNASMGLRTKETLEPIIHLGYHHEWRSGIHTLFLTGWLNDELTVTDPLHPTFFLITPPGEPATDAELMWADLRYRSTFENYSAELQQIWQQDNHLTILGGRFQIGNFHTRNVQTNPVVLGEILGFFDPTAPLAQQDFETDFQRWSLYGYHHWQILPDLRLIGGLAYDWIKAPENFRAPPVSDETKTIDQLSPKAGFIWTPNSRSAVRFAYTRSLAGASIDQSFLLEPSQVAGFNQSFRSIMPESVGGSESGAKFETFGLAWEQKIWEGTYLGISGQILNSEVHRTVGAFEFTGASFFAEPSGTHESRDYRESSFDITANQLLGNHFSIGASYRLTQADLKDNFTEVPDTAFILGFRPRQDLTAVLHRVALDTSYNHPSGFFALFQALWYQQSNQGYSPDIPGDDFWQLNAFAGYRFPRRKIEVRLGVLNLTDQDYQLNPLNLYTELPRERTFAARLQFNF